MEPFLRLEIAMPINHKDWRDKWGYYHTPKPCCVCGYTVQIGLEPRYGYAVCQAHSNIPPVEISKIIGETKCQK